MKLLLSTLFASALALPALATVSVVWGPTNPNTIVDSTGGTTGTATWLAQLIYSPDNVPSSLGTPNPLAVDPTEEILASRPVNTIGANGRMNGQSLSLDETTFSHNVVGGFVYTRIFNISQAQVGSVAPTFYGFSSIVSGTLAINDGNPTNGNDITSHQSFTVAVNQAIVPEPSTYAFFGLGAAVMGIRRLRKQS